MLRDAYCTASPLAVHRHHTMLHQSCAAAGPHPLAVQHHAHGGPSRYADLRHTARASCDSHGASGACTGVGSKFGQNAVMVRLQP